MIRVENDGSMDASGFPRVRVVIQGEEIVKRPAPLFIDQIDEWVSLPAATIGQFRWVWAIPDPENPGQGTVQAYLCPDRPDPAIPARMIGYFATNNLDHRGAAYWSPNPWRGIWQDGVFHPHGDAELFLNWSAPRDQWQARGLTNWVLPEWTAKAAYRVEVGAMAYTPTGSYAPVFGDLSLGTAVLPKEERKTFVQVNLSPRPTFCMEKFKGASELAHRSLDVVDSKRWIPVLDHCVYVLMSSQGKGTASVLMDGIMLKSRW